MQVEILRLVKLLPKNIVCDFWGMVPNHQILEYYKTNPVDMFINVSSIEGIPVSIMEAQSCGIPVIATTVGGTPEIVSSGNGVLLNSDPKPNEISEGIWELYSNEEKMEAKRAASVDNWQNNYNAQVNYAQFANDISDILRKEQREDHGID